MKANELMIGDWAINPVHKDARKIEGVYYDKELHCLVATDGRFPQEHFEPIPLTPEILEKNGFEKVGSYEWQPRIKVTRWRFYSNNLEDMVEILYAPKYDGFTWKGCDVNSVHLLQHALRLCGLNDLADSLKV